MTDGVPCSQTHVHGQKPHLHVAIPLDAEIVTADSLATALRSIPDINVEWYAFPQRHSRAVTIEELCAAILAALHTATAEGSKR
jgi:hypothetical protein